MEFLQYWSIMKYFFGILFLILLPAALSAQFYEFGQDPSSIKWRRIDTEHFRIIYPADFSEKAQVLAALLEENYPLNSAELDHEPRKIPVIIHNQTVYSNAFVTWAPKRMEFFSFPNPDIYPIDWLQELSVHEFRHVIQIDKLNKGLTRVMSAFLGEQATGVVAGLIPLWFYEGDAVSAETSLSNSGRGRLPSFEMELKTALLSGNKPYSLSKAYLGSYKDFVPDYYRLGYQMVNYARKEYGMGYWSEALDYIGRKPYLGSPFYFYMKKTTGRGQRALYDSTMVFLKEHWTETYNLRAPEVQTPLNKRDSKVYTNYSHPRLMSDSSVLSLKTGLNIIPRFVKNYPDGREEIIYYPGSMVSNRFSVFGEKIIWDEYVQDIRWRNRSYSIIKEYNTLTGQCRTLSRGSKYMSPAWSADGDSIVVVNASPDYRFSLVILSSEDGMVLKDIPSPQNHYLQFPEFIAGTSKIAAIASGERGKAIFEYDLKTEQWTEILNTGFVNVDQLKSAGNFLFFNGGFTGIDEIYSFNLSDKKLRKHSNSAFGSFHPDVSLEKGLLSYSTYGLKGYDIVLNSFDPEQQKEFVFPDSIIEQSFVSVNLKQETKVVNPSTKEMVKYQEKKYSKVSHLFRFHSWAPYWFDYTDPNIHDPSASPGISLLSQNSLSTAFTSLGYERKEGVNYLHSRFTYKGLFPIIDLSSTYGGTPLIAPITGVEPPVVDVDMNTSLSTYIPLNLTRGKIISGLQPSVQLRYNSIYFYHFSDSVYKKGMVYFEPRIYLYSYLRTSMRDLQPRFGFTFDSRYSSTPFENEIYGSNKSLRTNFYLPGIAKNQGLRLRGEWQKQDVDAYYFQNHLSMPRGYDYRTFIKMEKFSADYAFPILYPDIAIGPLLYLKRIRGNFFVDYMKGIEKYKIEDFKIITTDPEYLLSQGLELYADYHAFRFIFEFSSGVRFTYLPNEQSYSAEMLFTVDLNQF